MRRGSTRRAIYAIAAVSLLGVAAVAAATASTDTRGGAAASTVKVGFIYSRTGALSGFGAEELEGFQFGLSYLKSQKNTCGGHKLSGRNGIGSLQHASGDRLETIGDSGAAFRPRDDRELAGGRRVGPGDPRAVVLDLRERVRVQREARGVVRLERERTIAGDADRDDVVAVTVDRRQDSRRRRAADRMLA